MLQSVLREGHWKKSVWRVSEKERITKSILSRLGYAALSRIPGKTSRKAKRLVKDEVLKKQTPRESAPSEEEDDLFDLPPVLPSPGFRSVPVSILVLSSPYPSCFSPRLCPSRIESCRTRPSDPPPVYHVDCFCVVGLSTNKT